jgi:hypothetical protein
VILAEDRMIQCIISGPTDWAKGDKAQAFMKSIAVKASVKR